VELAPKEYRLFCAYMNRTPHENGCTPVNIDLTDLEALRETLERIWPKIIIHAARMDPFDKDPVNIKPVAEQLVNVIRSIGSTLVYVSSDAVFDGGKGNYTEADTPHPITPYGKARQVVETTIENNLESFLIVRTSYIYGKNRSGWDKRTAQLLHEGKKGGPIFRFVDMYRSPILVDDLAKRIWLLIEKKARGIVHVAGERTSIYEFCKKILKMEGMDPRIVHEDRLGDTHPDIGPDTSLDIGLMKDLLR
jgi:dTDP-4-dehydrorhamnose reductase